MHNRQGRFKDQGASRGKSENMLVRRLTRVIHTKHDIGFTIVTFDSVPRPPACSYDEFKPFSRPFIRSSLLMDNEVGFSRESSKIRNHFRFRYFWTPAFRSILRRSFSRRLRNIYRGSPRRFGRNLTFILVVIASNCCLF